MAHMEILLEIGWLTFIIVTLFIVLSSKIR